MKLLSGKNASPAQELKLECAGCHFPLRNFFFCFYIQCRGFAFSHVLRWNVVRGGFFCLHRRCKQVRPEGMPPRGITIYTLNFSNKAGMSYTDEICNIPVAFDASASNGWIFSGWSAEGCRTKTAVPPIFW